MTVGRLVLLLLQLSIFLLVFSLGLRASLADTTSLVRRPRLLLRSLVSMNLVMPVFAAVMAWVFRLDPVVKIALVFLAVSPVPPALPREQSKLGGSSTYIYGLLVTAALFSILIVPLTLEILGKIFRQDVHIGLGAVAKVMLASVLLPLGLGIFVRHLAPRASARISQRLSLIAFLLLVAGAVALLVPTMPTMIGLIGNGTILAIIAFVVAGVAIGHWLGGPDPGERTVLALATASRHPGLALVIARSNYPGRLKTIGAAILLYLLVKSLVLIPYTRWRKRQLSRPGQPKESGAQRRIA